MQDAPFQRLLRTYPLNAVYLGSVQRQISDFRASKARRWFLDWREIFEEENLYIHRSYRKPLQSLRQFLTRPLPGQMQIICLLKKITDGLFQIAQAKVRMRVFDLDTIFIDTLPDESLAILFDIPEFPSLYRITYRISVQDGTALPYTTSFEQLITIFLQVIEGSVLGGNLEGRVNSLGNLRLRRICLWMMGVDREQDESRLHGNLQTLYFQLDECQKLLLGRPEQDQEEQITYYTMFQIDMYANTPPAFYIDREQITIQPRKNKQFHIDFDYVGGQKLLVELKHIKTGNLQTLELNYADLPIYLRQQWFRSITELHDWITKWPHKKSTVLSSARFSFKTSRNWKEIRKQIRLVNRLYTLVMETPHQMMAYNDTLLYRQLFQAKILPDQKILPPLKGLLQDKQLFIRHFCLDLFENDEFVHASEFIRIAIELQLQRGDERSGEFVGKGNDEDMLGNVDAEELDQLCRIRKHKNGNFLSTMATGTTWDWLFVCEYLGINMRRSYEWYRRKLVEYPENKAVLYGLLNFCYQNDYLEVSNRELQQWCKQLQRSYVVCPQAVNMLIANIYYYRLANTQRARGLAIVIQQYNTANITAKMILYASEAQERQPEYLQQLMGDHPHPHPHIKFQHLRGLQHLRQRSLTQAKDIFRECIKRNPYFRPAYYGLIDVANLQLQNRQINLDKWMQETDLGIQQSFQTYNSKDGFLLYKRGLVMQAWAQGNEHRLGKAMDLYRECLRKNPTFSAARLRLRELQVEVALRRGSEMPGLPFDVLPQFWRANYGTINQVVQSNRRLDQQVFPFKS